MYVYVDNLTLKGSVLMFNTSCHIFGFQVGIFAATVGRMRTTCVIHVHFPCARRASRNLFSFVSEPTRAFARLA